MEMTSVVMYVNQLCMSGQGRRQTFAVSPGILCFGFCTHNVDRVFAVGPILILAGDGYCSDCIHICHMTGCFTGNMDTKLGN